MSNKPPSESPPWSGTTKAIVALASLALLAAILIRFHAIIPLLVVAGIVSYLVLPAVRLLNQRGKFSWSLATNLSFVFLFLVIIGVSTATGLAVIQQLQALLLTLQGFLSGIPDQLQALNDVEVVLGPWRFDFSRFDLGLVAEQAIASLQPVLRQVGVLVRSLATVAIESIGRLIFILATAYFLTYDHDRIQSSWSRLSIPGFEQDLKRLRESIENIWNSFLRGQLLIVLVTGLLSWGLMSVLGVRFSLALGVLGGLAKFVPIIGPVSAGAIAAVVAIFQPTNWFNLTPIAHAGVIVVTVFVLDQMIDYILLPRIMGSSLNLPPVVILVGAIVGASLAGVIGLLLSAPAMATFLLLSRYGYRKLVDLSPWDPPIDARPREELKQPRWLRMVRRRKKVEPEQKDSQVG